MVLAGVIATPTVAHAKKKKPAKKAAVSKDPPVPLECRIEVRGEKEGKQIFKIPERMPGASLKDGMACNGSVLSGFMRFGGPESSSWILSIYADRPKKTNLIIKLHEADQPEPPQTTIVLNERPCNFAKKHGMILSSSLQSAKPGSSQFTMELYCY